MTIPDRNEFRQFEDKAAYVLYGRDLNVAWKVATILAAGETSRLTPDERRDLGQELRNALEKALLVD